MGGIIMNETQTCCFTGHRNIPAEKYPEIQRALMFKVIELIHEGIRYFYSGGALGFDTMAALTVLNLKKRFPYIQLILILPYKDQEKGRSEENKNIYDRILSKADKVVYMSEHYYKGCMHARNRSLVDKSGVCVYYLTSAEGGAAYTVNYAKQKCLQIIRIP